MSRKPRPGEGPALVDVVAMLPSPLVLAQVTYRVSAKWAARSAYAPGVGVAPPSRRHRIRVVLDRESRLYKDIKEEGVKEGLAIAIAKMVARKMSVAEIAAILELDEETVQKALTAAK